MLEVSDPGVAVVECDVASVVTLPMHKVVVGYVVDASDTLGYLVVDGVVYVASPLAVANEVDGVAALRTQPTLSIVEYGVPVSLRGDHRSPATSLSVS